MSAPKHNPDGVPSGPAAIARARREIEAIKAEIRAGNPDLNGLVRGLVDWSCELRRLEKEQEEQTRQTERGQCIGSPE
jgi:hypothetical protein